VREFVEEFAERGELGSNPAEFLERLVRLRLSG
jgi:hypothetical protein